MTFGTFSFINAGLLSALLAVRPETDFEEFDVASAIRQRPARLSRCLAGAIREYGPASLASRKALRYRLWRSGATYQVAHRLICREVEAGGFDFTLQTQSLANAAVPGVPNYVYTDHVARQRITSGWDEGTGRPSASWLALERRIYEDAAHVFVLGSATRRALVDGYDVPGDRVTVARAGASTPATIATAPEAYAKRRILFVGADWERKGGPDLVEAFAGVRRRLPDATLTIAGCSPRVEIDGCEVLGRLPRDDVEELYRQCSVFCMPSRIEPYGLVYIEAMSHGRPVVATRVGSVSDIVEDGRTGHLVPPGDVPALTRALIDLLADPPRARAFGLAGLERAEGFTWDAVARGIADRLPRPPQAPAAPARVSAS